MSPGEGDHFSCSLSATLIAFVAAEAGEETVVEVLRRAGCERPREYLQDRSNWFSYDEAIGLLAAAAEVTGDPLFARHLGERAWAVIPGSPMLQMYRAQGSPEEVYRRIPAASAKLTRVTRSEAKEVREGYAEIVVTALPGFPRAREHCEWTRGLMTQTPVPFGLPPASVEHDECTVDGAPCCRYRMSWQTAANVAAGDQSYELEVLRNQLGVMSDRVETLFETAAELIASEDLDVTLERITNRAAHELRNPRCLLVVGDGPGSRSQVHHRGLDPVQAREIADTVLADGESAPAGWLVAPVRSSRRDYGRLVAVYDGEDQQFPQERRLLEVFAGYAAAALDSASALAEATERHRQTSALLELARALASAGSSEEIAGRLVDAVPHVIDCDRVAVYVWEDERRELVRKAVTGQGSNQEDEELSFKPDRLELLRELLERPRAEPLLVTADQRDHELTPIMAEHGAVASVIMPIATREHLLGALVVSVTSAPERLELDGELRDRLSGVAAHATTALENGRLVDHITHQARHDGLTGLVNRTHFSDELSQATAAAEQNAQALFVFYIDLDRFKPVNDRLGHAVGDDLLRQVAQRLNESVRVGDIVARLGGDEFAVLVQGITNASEVEIVARRLAGAFERPFDVAGRPLDVVASIGRASWPTDAREVDELLQLADAAMYERKRLNKQADPRARDRAYA